MYAPSYLADPHVQYLWQLLDDLGRGLIQVPRFQRPLVWDLDRRLELLRSIRDGIPMGTIMLWRTNNKDVSCYHRFGPYKIPPTPEGSAQQYVLDGVQRLSTLYAALYRAEADSSSEERVYTFYYDLENEDFVVEEVENVEKSEMLPLTALFDDVAFPMFQRGLEGESAHDWISRSTKLARSFQKYKVPIVPISTDDVDLAAKTFDRVNKQGVEVNDMDMIHALTYSEEFALRERIDEIRQESLGPVGWENVKPDWILDACKAALDLSIYDTEARELSARLKEHPETLDDVSGSIKRAARFLKKECELPNPILVPYALQGALLAEAFRIKREPGPEIERILHAWFWLTTLGEAFAGISGYRTSLVTEDVRRMVADGKPRWSFPRQFSYGVLPARATFRSARVKALALRLASRKANGTEVLNSHYNNALGHLVPRSEIDQRAYANMGNRLVVDPRDINEVRGQVRSGDTSTLEENIISLEAFQHFLLGDYSRFVEIRLRDLRRFEARFVEQLQETFVVEDTSDG